MTYLKDPYDAQTSPSSQNSPPDAGKVLGSIDQAASPSSQNSPEDPGAPIAPLTSANYGGVNSLVMVSYEEQCPGSTCAFSNATFNDDTAQYMKADHAEINRIRNQAFNMVGETQDNTNPPFTGRQDSDPQGG